MRRPASNLFRFSPDYAQREAGLGAYAYHLSRLAPGLDRRRLRNPGWAGAAAFTAEFCALGGRYHDRLRRHEGRRRTRPGHPARRHRDVRRTHRRPVADPRLAGLETRTALAACWCGARTSRTRAHAARSGARLDGVVGTTWLPSSPPSPCSATTAGAGTPRSPDFPSRFANHPVVIGYHNARGNGPPALGRIRSADVRAGLMAELAAALASVCPAVGHPRPQPASGSRRLPLADRRPWRQVSLEPVASCRTSSRASPACSRRRRRPVPAPSRAGAPRRPPGRGRTISVSPRSSR